MSSECGYDRHDEEWNKIEKEREELIERSNFKEEDITVGNVYDWQNVLEQIQKYAKKFDIKYVIIYTNLDAHNINESVAEGAHYYEIDYMKAVQQLGIIASKVSELENAILDYQTLDIVSACADTRTCAGPYIQDETRYNYQNSDFDNLKIVCHGYKKNEHQYHDVSKLSEMIVHLEWAS